MVLSVIKRLYFNFKEIQNLEGHQNCITGSKVKAFLLNGWILTIGGASEMMGLLLQPAQQACFLLETSYLHSPEKLQ